MTHSSTKTLMSLLAIFFLSVVTSYSAVAGGSTIPENNGKITGHVSDAGDQLSIPYATVALYSQKDSTLVTGVATDDNGNFLLEKVPDGKYYLIVNFIGYSKTEIPNIEISKGNRTKDMGEIQLHKATQAIEEVEVTAERDAVQYKIDKKVVNISKNMTATGNQLSDALENVPSIQTDAEGNVMLRGSTNYTVLIDGKPTALSGSDALRQIPAMAVENVEIITNPSAKYDPDGTAGIINIVMKKEYQTGFNGLINASVGTQWKHSGDFTFNYRTDKVNYFLSARYSRYFSYPSTEIYSETEFRDTLFYLTQVADREQGHNPYNVKAGADFYLSDNSTLTFSTQYGHWGFDLNMDSKITDSNNMEDEIIYKNTLSNLDMGGEYLNGSLTFDQKYGENHNWQTTLFVSQWDGGTTTDVNERLTTSDWTVISPDEYQSAQNNTNYEIRFKTDYTRPLGDGGKLESGYQLRMKDEDGSYLFENYDYTNNLWEEDADFTNQMKFTRSIQSLYAAYGNTLAGFQYQIGLRGEYTDRVLSQITNAEDYNSQKFDFFPSVHISRQLPKMQQIQASYSRRVNRPEIWHLNPFPVFSDSYMRQTGNPYLLPEFTDSYELNYMKRSQIGFVALEAYYRQTNDSHDQTITMQDDNVALIRTENLDHTYAYGAELSGNVRYKKWLNVYASANVYNYSIEGENVSATADLSSIKTDFRLSTTFIFLKNTRLQLTGFYNAPTITSQGLRSEMYGMNAAVSKGFFKDKLTLTLSGRNVLNTMKFEFNSETENMYTDFTFNMEYPVVMFSLSYRINNYKQRHDDPDTQTNVGGGVL